MAGPDGPARDRAATGGLTATSAPSSRRHGSYLASRYLKAHANFSRLRPRLVGHYVVLGDAIVGRLRRYAGVNARVAASASLDARTAWRYRSVVLRSAWPSTSLTVTGSSTRVRR